MEVVRLLESKNRCLKRFLELTEVFIRNAEAGDLAKLDYFQQRREAVIKTLDLYDVKITELAGTIQREERTPELIQAVERALLEKDFIVRKIVAADDRVIQLIEQEKDKLVREMSSSQKSHSTLKKFKSSWAPGAESGSGLDEKL